MAEPIEIVFYLLNESGYFANRIYPTQAPQGVSVTNPFVVLNTISTTPTNTKKEASTLDRVRIQVSIFQNSFSNISTQASRVRQILENIINEDVLLDGTIVQCSTFEGQVDGIDSGAGLDGVYYIHQDYYFWITR
jgi:CRISPR/Cas system-associated endoribonuclease Cas2